MGWSWSYETADGDAVGASEDFETRSDAESWLGEEFGELADRGIDQVRLFEDDREVFGPMGLHPDA